MAHKKYQSEQSQRFIEAARVLGCDENPAHFDEILKKVARHKPPEKPIKKLAKPPAAKVK